jgi:predicted RNA-binding Zn ribbon-like protein
VNCTTATLASSARQDREYELIAAHPVLDLVNTLDWRFRDGNSEELLDSHRNLLRFLEQSGLLTPGHAGRMARGVREQEAARVLEAVKELREAAAEVLYAMLDRRKPTAASIKTLEACFKAASKHQNLSWSDSSLIWDWPRATASPELPLWILSLSASSLLTSNEIEKVRACDNPECRWLFLDTSKNHTRRWCDMKICGNRMKARRFKAQHRA